MVFGLQVFAATLISFHLTGDIVLDPKANEIAGNATVKRHF